MADNRIIRPGQPAAEKRVAGPGLTAVSIRSYLQENGYDLSTLSERDIINRLEQSYGTYKIGREVFREPLGRGQ